MKKLALLLGISTCLGVVCFLVLINYQPPKTLPVMGKVPEFQFTSQDEETFDHQKLQGKIWVADFFFTSCGGPCPAMVENMKTLQASFAGVDEPRLVNFTVHPSQDTPDILRKYAKKHNADTTRWHFLRAEEAVVHKLAYQGFKVGDTENVMNHSSKFILVDRGMRIRGYYEGTDPEDVKELIADINQLLREPV